jgi:hypothetical protein
MRKAILLTAAAAFLAVPALAQAQTGAGASTSGTIDATASLNAFIVVSGERNVEFGEVAVGSSNEQDKIGMFHVEHSHAVNFTFEGGPLVNQEQEEDPDTIDAEWLCAAGSDDDDTGLALGSCVGLSGDAPAGNGNADTYFFVGGILDLSGEDVPSFGEYKGTLTLTATVPY